MFIGLKTTTKVLIVPITIKIAAKASVAKTTKPRRLCA